MALADSGSEVAGGGVETGGCTADCLGSDGAGTGAFDDGDAVFAADEDVVDGKEDWTDADVGLIDRVDVAVRPVKSDVAAAAAGVDDAAFADPNLDTPPFLISPLESTNPFLASRDLRSAANDSGFDGTTVSPVSERSWGNSSIFAVSLGGETALFG